MHRLPLTKHRNSFAQSIQDDASFVCRPPPARLSSYATAVGRSVGCCLRCGSWSGSLATGGWLAGCLAGPLQRWMDGDLPPRRMANDVGAAAAFRLRATSAARAHSSHMRYDFAPFVAHRSPKTSCTSSSARTTQSTPRLVTFVAHIFPNMRKTAHIIPTTQLAQYELQ